MGKSTMTVEYIRTIVEKRMVLAPDTARVLLNEIDRLRTALAPFANHGIGEYTGNEEAIRSYFDGSGPTNLTVGDIRRAEQAYKGN